ncbi:protein kinase C zeta type-like [Penaeus chinensis]|uniref:protein kinase C zeta type-like n=1 Tax=Penaeus chinensis TaxID=139456 RepID=UPI001FB5CFED|nr:protein kinase C zeta type-like [Penaeus chinensis]
MVKDNSQSEDLVLEAERLEELLSNALELGAGATGRALLVRRGESEAVLKVAHSEVYSDQFKEEFEILKEVAGAGGSPKALSLCSNPPAIMCTFVGPYTLRHVVRDLNFSDARLLGLSLRLCVAVQEVHDKGYIHNDLEADNIVVDATGQISIVDFGSTCRPGQTAVYRSCPTRNTAPEVLGGGQGTEASDVFALGGLLMKVVREMTNPPRTLRRLARKMRRPDPLRRPSLPSAVDSLARCYFSGDECEDESQYESEAESEDESEVAGQ